MLVEVKSDEPMVSVRIADQGFAEYVYNSDFSFEISGYLQPQMDIAVAAWPSQAVVPYRKCYGIDPEEFSAYRDAQDSAVFMAFLGDRAVGHMVISTNWNGYAHVDELAVDVSARRHGVAKALLDVAQFWSRKKSLPGVMLETQNNNFGACRLYQRCGYVLGGVDHLRYRGIDPQTAEVAVFWYLLFDR